MNDIKWDEKALKEWNRKACLVFDGITNQKRFKEVNPKILWILKESNTGDNPREKSCHRDFHKNVTDYPLWRRTYKKIIYVVYGVLNKCFTYRNLHEITDDAKIDGINVLEDIAIININKIGGDSMSKQSKINKEYDVHKEFLLEQIKAINPDIIINSSRVWNLFTDLVPEENIKEYGKQDLQYGITEEGRFVIHYYHPNQRKKGVTDLIYCNNILQVIKKRYE